MALSLFGGGDGGGGQVPPWLSQAAPAPTPAYQAYAQPQQSVAGGSPFALRAGGTSGSLGSLIPNYQQAASNPYGLADYGTDNNVNIGGKNYSLRQDSNSGNYTLSDTSNNDTGAYIYDGSGNFQNWAPYNNSGNNNWVVPLVAALTMGAGGALAGGASGATGGAGGMVGDATAAGYGGLDAAGTASMGGGASIGGGSSLGSLGAGTAAGGGGFMMGGGAEGYGGLDAASTSTMGGGASVNGGAALGASGGGLANTVAGSGGGGASSGLTTGNPIVDKAIGAAGSSALSSGISSALGSGSGNTASGVGGILSGAYDAYAQNKAANNMLDFMKTQQGKIDSIYNDPNSPVAKTMWGQMSAADAAAGRNSQYGTRTTDFLGKFGGDYAKYTAALTQGLAGNYQQAYNQQASAGAGLAAGVGKAVGAGATSALNSIVQNGSSYVNPSTGGGYGGYTDQGLQTGSVNGDQIYG